MTPVVTLETRLARYAARAFRYSFLAASVFLLYACMGKQNKTAVRENSNTHFDTHTRTQAHTDRYPSIKEKGNIFNTVFCSFVSLREHAHAQTHTHEYKHTDLRLNTGVKST